MVSLHVAAVLMALSAPGETVLLDFTAPWCGPCQQMHPIVDRLASAGYPVRKVNVDQDKQLAARFGVSSIPCFVLLVDGKEVSRRVGGMSYGQFTQMFQAAGVSPGGRVARGQSPGALAGRRGSAQPFPPAGGSSSRMFAQPPAARRAMTNTRPRQIDDRLTAKMVEASVRVKVKDAAGFSNGSGTIIDVHGREALILTCGHIFRDSGGKGEVTIDLFGDEPASGIKAHLIAFDLKRDLGLLSFRPGVRVTAAPVAPAEYKVQKGDRVTSVGCSRAAAPTAEQSHITSTRKFLGPPHVMVAGRPVVGRSGGGLFDKDGQIIGVCNASDDEDNEGMYAAIEAIHGELDAAKLSFVYRTGGADEQLSETMADAPERDRQTPTMTPNMPSRASNFENEDGRLNTAITGMSHDSDGAEVICIVRSLGNPNSKSDVIVLDRVSADFLQQLRREQSTQSDRHPTSDRRPAIPLQRNRINPSVDRVERGSADWQPVWRKPAIVSPARPSAATK